MERYDYRAALYEDIKAYIEENKVDITEYDIEERLQDELWCEDSVTGNASGRYTFNAWTAEENICHNFYLRQEACSEFDMPFDRLKSAEQADVTIRCYLLNEMISKVVEDMLNEKEAA